METVVCHFWVPGKDGELTLYEQDYLRYPIREGVMCHAKVYNSERPCQCADRGNHERRLVVTMS